MGFNIEEYVKLPYFLKFIGVAAVVVGVYFGLHGFYKALVFGGVGMFAAGALYDRLYR